MRNRARLVVQKRADDEARFMGDPAKAQEEAAQLEKRTAVSLAAIARSCCRTFSAALLPALLQSSASLLMCSLALQTFLAHVRLARSWQRQI